MTGTSIWIDKSPQLIHLLTTVPSVLVEIYGNDFVARFRPTVATRREREEGPGHATGSAGLDVEMTHCVFVNAGEGGGLVGF